MKLKEECNFVTWFFKNISSSENTQTYTLFKIRPRPGGDQFPSGGGQTPPMSIEHRSRDRDSGGMCTPREVDVCACVMRNALVNVRMLDRDIQQIPVKHFKLF